MTGLTRQRAMVAALVRALARRHGQPPRLFETHLSWVIVLPAFACKIKKAVHLSFLDWRSERERERCCHEELRLNRRYASQLYMDVVPITGPAAAPQIGGTGLALEHAVRMRTFPQDALWSQRIGQGRLTDAEVASLAHVLADLHAAAGVVPADAPWGRPEHIAARTLADLREVRTLVPDARAEQDMLSAWHRRALPQMLRLSAWRRERGAVRDCHGDLHCGNLLTLQGIAVPFDAIEFDPGMRWIDRMQDLAFPWMDLQFHGRPDLAACLLSDYLQRGGDYTGLPVLRYYRVQRALVRAKVAALNGERALAHRYVEFAHACTVVQRGGLVVTHGPSGAGKSTACAALAGPLTALVLRSDVERRRAAGGRPSYTAEETRRTYTTLRRLARHALAAGLTVLVDATCLQRWQRDTFRSLAQQWGFPFLLLDLAAAPHELRERLRRRAATEHDPSDADEAVLASQLDSAQPLDNAEQAAALRIDARQPCTAAVIERLRHHELPCVTPGIGRSADVPIA